jgi:uncharacterized protein (TIRG00374 family)
MKSSFIITLQVAVSGCLLYFIFSAVPIGQIVETLASTNIALVVMAFVITAVTRLFAAHQMRMVTDCQGMELTSFQIFKINLMASFYELFLPTFVGSGPIRWYKLSQRNKRRAGALAAIAFNRLINVFTLILIGSACWMADERARESGLSGWVLIMLLGLLILLYAALVKSKVFPFFSMHAANKRRRIIPHFLQGRVERVTQALGQFQTLTPMAKLQILASSLMQDLLGILSVYLLAMSLALPLSVLTLAWIRACLGILTMIPLSVAGLGIREGTLAILLQPYGVELQAAIALALLLFLTKIVWGTLGGILEIGNLFVAGKQRAVPKQLPT